MAPMTRAGHRAGAKEERDTARSRERDVPVPWCWAVKFDMPCLFFCVLCPVRNHFFLGIGGQSYDVVFGVAWFTTYMAIFSHWLGPVDRSRSVFVLVTAAKLIVPRFGVNTVAHGDAAMRNSLRLLMNVEALVQWTGIRRGMPY